MKKQKSKIRGKDEIAFSVISMVLVAAFAFLCFVPFYLIAVASVTSERAIITQGYRFFVDAGTFSLSGYQTALKDPLEILRAYGVTIFVTFTGTILALLITTMTGYVLSRYDFPWKNGFSFFFFFTTLFNGGLVPWYLLCTQTFRFNNSIHALIIPGMFSVWNMIIAKSFIKGIAREMIEAAKVDGAGDFLIYHQVILPMSRPLLATIGLFTALGYWNDWYNCMLFNDNRAYWNLQYTLQNILNSAEQLRRIAEKTGMKVGNMPAESLKMAMTIIATGPIVLLYPALQKHFVKGLTIGAIKG